MKLSADIGDEIEDPTMFRRIVGGLIYMTITRPNLSYVVGLISQFMQMPRKPHLDAVRHILRYVKSTLHYGLFYEAGKEIQVLGYTNANWAGSMYDRRSTNGFMFSLGNAVVTWSSKKQHVVYETLNGCATNGNVVAVV